MKSKAPEYIVIDIGNQSEAIEDRIKKILSQIPKGKAIKLSDIDFDLEQKEIIVQIIDQDSIPKITKHGNR